MRRKKEKYHAVSDDNTNCELQENLAYITAAHNKLWSEDSEMEEEEKEGEREEEGCEERNTYVKDKAMDLEPVSLELPCRQYLQEKEVCRAIHQLYSIYKNSTVGMHQSAKNGHVIYTHAYIYINV